MEDYTPKPLKKLELGSNKLNANPKTRLEIIAQLGGKAEQQFKDSDEKIIEARRLQRLVGPYIRFLRKAREFYEDEGI